VPGSGRSAPFEVTVLAKATTPVELERSRLGRQP
jgi:hypothetical protein